MQGAMSAAVAVITAGAVWSPVTPSPAAVAAVHSVTGCRWCGTLHSTGGRWCGTPSLRGHSTGGGEQSRGVLNSSHALTELDIVLERVMVELDIVLKKARGYNGGKKRLEPK